MNTKIHPSLSHATALLLGIGVVAGAAAPSQAQTYRQTWTTTEDFAQAQVQVNVTATEVPDQLQLNLGQIETPYLWIANSTSNTVARIDTATGRALSVTSLPGINPSRTAVDIDFNCWVGGRASAGKAYKLSAVDGTLLGETPQVGNQSRGVAINAAGEVWVSTTRDREGANDAKGWMKIDPDTFQPLQSFDNPIGSYGLAIDPYGRIFSTTAWLGGRSVQRINGETGAIEQRWRLTHRGNANIYGITVDINGNAWGAYWDEPYVAWIDGNYQCPDDAVDCTISSGNGLIRDIDVSGVVQAAGGSSNLGGRGIAVDANRFVWAVMNDLDTGGWENAQSYAVKIDGATGEPILAVPTGTGSIGITPDADGFIWVVNYRGGGANFESSYTCPNDFNPNSGGTVTKLRSSDGSVVATYPTCGTQPYTYSDMAGYNLRSVTLRSGTWRVTHDSGRPDLEWGRVNWRSQEFDDTTFRVRVRASDDPDALPLLPFVDVDNNDALPLRGQHIEVEAFFFTRNDFIGPVLEDLTVSSVCIPEAEICDGFDNDCDGVVDNGNPGGGAPCETGLDGVCNQGLQLCVFGRYECSPALDPVEESCNGRDDNCNGRIDEGVTNLCGTCGDTPVETCNGEDDDCDGLIDEDVTNACGTCGEPPTETCNGEDDDCDGLTDEGLLNACGTCGLAPEELCDDEDNDCDGLIDEGVVNNCGSCGEPPEEVCDGVDNDCDGLADEELRNRCGLCGPAPEEICNGVDDNCDGRIDEDLRNDCGLCGPAPMETCNGVDDNCDGRIDEGLTNACGGCGDVPNELCNGIDDDCDESVDEGVTNACGSCGLLPIETCDGQDNDCDGSVDEDVLNACGTCGDLGPDLCDGVDSDCDGVADEDPECIGAQVCVEGECAEPCAQNECPRGFVCMEGYCRTDACVGRECPDGETCFLGDCLDTNEVACRNVECPVEGELCVQGQCVGDPCGDVTCDSGTSCWLGECIDEDDAACRAADCAPGQLCEAGQCITDPCSEVVCPRGEACMEGYCEDACLSTVCGAGFTCKLGACIRQPCFEVECGAGQACMEGNCVWSACVDVECGAEEQCGQNGCEPIGACGEAVCTEAEVCVVERCVDKVVYQDFVDNGGDINDIPGLGLGGDGDGGSGGGGGGGGADEGGGCACASVARPAGEGRVPGWLWLAVVVGGLVVGRRR